MTPRDTTFDRYHSLVHVSLQCPTFYSYIFPAKYIVDTRHELSLEMSIPERVSEPHQLASRVPITSYKLPQEGSERFSECMNMPSTLS